MLHSKLTRKLITVRRI